MFPCDPCADCPRLVRGLSLPCLAQTSGHARFCELAAMGREDYIELLCDGKPSPPAHHTTVLDKMVRRAGKVRLKLGAKPPDRH